MCVCVCVCVCVCTCVQEVWGDFVLHDLTFIGCLINVICVIFVTLIISDDSIFSELAYLILIFIHCFRCFCKHKVKELCAYNICVCVCACVCVWLWVCVDCVYFTMCLCMSGYAHEVWSGGAKHFLGSPLPPQPSIYCLAASHDFTY